MHSAYNLNMMNNIKLDIYRHDFLFQHNIRYYQNYYYKIIIVG